MSILEWSESSSEENTGVDHLGMRVADESSYSQLIDFTTTVTWRPRYYSFLCWASQKAFQNNGGDFHRETSRVDHKGYQRTIKQMEYGLVAATLLNDTSASKVAGTEKVSLAIEKLKKENGSELVLRGNHLKASAGGLSIYAGVMRTLGLLSSSEGFDIPILGSSGDLLAKAFEQSLALSGIDNPLDNASISIENLEKIGASCALNGLGAQALTHESVRKELDLIRKVIFDWDNFNKGTNGATRRILSLGLILKSRELYPEEEASLALFREFTLLGAAKVSGKIIPLDLQPIYSPVLVEWKMYQVHAYITFALESILSLILVLAEELQDERGDRIKQADLVASLLAYVPHAPKEKLSTNNTGVLEEWWALQLSELVDKLKSVVVRNRAFDLCEPELLFSISKLASPRGSADLATWAHDTFLLLLMAQVRMRYFLQTHGQDAWIGTDQSFRLTPNTLTSHLQKALDHNLSVLEYAKKATSDLVIKQHHQNALRKLISQPEKDTAKFLIEGPYFVPIGTHKPGTSSPRYENALLFLQDLGFLTQEKKPKVTPDGEAILGKIRGETK